MTSKKLTKIQLFNNKNCILLFLYSNSSCSAQSTMLQPFWWRCFCSATLRLCTRTICVRQ